MEHVAECSGLRLGLSDALLVLAGHVLAVWQLLASGFGIMVQGYHAALQTLNHTLTAISCIPG